MLLQFADVDVSMSAGGKALSGNSICVLLLVIFDQASAVDLKVRKGSQKQKG